MRRWMVALLLVAGSAAAGENRFVLRNAELANNWPAALEAAEAMAKAAPASSADSAHASWRRAEALGHLGRHEDAAAAFAAFEEAHGGAQDPAMRAELAWGLTARGEWLGNREQFLQAIQQVDAVLARVGDAGDPRLDPPLSRAMGMRVAAIGKTGDVAGAMRGIEAVEARYGSSSNPQVQRHVALTMMVRGFMQVDAKDDTAAIRSFDRVIDRYGSAKAVEPQQVAMIARTAKISSLVALKRNAEAKAIARAVVESIGDGTPEPIREAAAPIAVMLIALELNDVGGAAGRGANGAVEPGSPPARLSLSAP